MKIERIEGDRAMLSAGNVKRMAAINFLTNPKIGDYVIVHAGFAIERLDPKEAEETLEILRRI